MSTALSCFLGFQQLWLWNIKMTFFMCLVCTCSTSILSCQRRQTIAHCGHQTRSSLLLLTCKHMWNQMCMAVGTAPWRSHQTHDRGDWLPVWRLGDTERYRTTPKRNKRPGRVYTLSGFSKPNVTIWQFDNSTMCGKNNKDEERPWLSLSIKFKSIQVSSIDTDKVRLHCKKEQNENKLQYQW